MRIVSTRSFPAPVLVRAAGFSLLLACAAGTVLPPLAALEPVRLRVLAGKHLRRDAPVSWPLPEAFRKGGAALRLERVDGGRNESVSVQRDLLDGSARWIARGEMAPGSAREYVLSAASDAGALETRVPVVEATNDGKVILFRAGGRPVLTYNQAVVKPPGEPDPPFDRSGYIHPVWTPSGRLLTNDFPPHHKHHHGIWFPWTRTVFEGREVDFWNSGAKQGRVEFAGLDSFGGGRVFGWLRTRHRHLDLKAPGGEKVALEERWEVRVYALDDHFLFDLTSVQSCASESPLELKQYRYGGLGFRGSHEWEGPHAYFLTSEGKTRADGHATTSRWCEIYGAIQGAKAGVTVMCHPRNFRFPQPMRIHPSEPFFNYAPCQAGDFEIAPGTPYVSRYRFYVHDGDVDAEVSERLWRDYAERPEVRAVVE